MIQGRRILIGAELLDQGAQPPSIPEARGRSLSWQRALEQALAQDRRDWFPGLDLEQSVGLQSSPSSVPELGPSRDPFQTREPHPRPKEALPRGGETTASENMVRSTKAQPNPSVSPNPAEWPRQRQWLPEPVAEDHPVPSGPNPALDPQALGHRFERAVMPGFRVDPEATPAQGEAHLPPPPRVHQPSSLGGAEPHQPRTAESDTSTTPQSEPVVHRTVGSRVTEGEGCTWEPAFRGPSPLGSPIPPEAAFSMPPPVALPVLPSPGAEAPMAEDEIPNMSRMEDLSARDPEPGTGIRVHTERSPDGLHVWVGMDLKEAIPQEYLLAHLHRWVAASGERLASLVCNGRSLWDGPQRLPSESPGDSESEYSPRTIDPDHFPPPIQSWSSHVAQRS